MELLLCIILRLVELCKGMPKTKSTDVEVANDMGDRVIALEEMESMTCQLENELHNILEIRYEFRVIIICLCAQVRSRISAVRQMRRCSSTSIYKRTSLIPSNSIRHPKLEKYD